MTIGERPNKKNFESLNLTQKVNMTWKHCSTDYIEDIQLWKILLNEYNIYFIYANLLLRGNNNNCRLLGEGIGRI